MACDDVVEGACELSTIFRRRDDSQVLPCFDLISGEAVECGRVR